MKRNALIILIVFSTLDVFSQLNKGDILISAEGNYTRTNFENGVTTNRDYTIGKYLHLGTSIGTFITDKLIIGVGLDYNWSNEKRMNSLDFDNFMQVGQMEIKSHVILPTVFIGYYQRIIDRLYFNGTIRFSYGKVKSETQSVWAGMTNPDFTSGTTQSAVGVNYTRFSLDTAESDYYSTEVCPELTYFVSPKVGLSLGLGGVKYSMTDGKVENSNWSVNFNPAYWNLGVKIKI